MSAHDPRMIDENRSPQFKRGKPTAPDSFMHAVKQLPRVENTLQIWRGSGDAEAGTLAVMGQSTCWWVLAGLNEALQAKGREYERNGC